MSMQNTPDKYRTLRTAGPYTANLLQTIRIDRKCSRIALITFGKVLSVMDVG
jgi:hypothetical protein